MDNNVMISVIIPCYNCEKTVDRCISSVLNQTYTNIEVFAIDDGSVDRTLERLENLQKKDARIKVIHQENEGPSAARNVGLLNAQGDYIAFVDSDDYIRQDAYELLLRKAIECSAEITICNYNTTYKNIPMVEHKHVLPDMMITHDEVIRNVIQQYYGGDMTGLPTLWNKLYRSSFIKGMEFNTALYRAEDWWFNMHAFEQAQRIATISEALYFYFQDAPGSLMKRMDINFYGEWIFARKYLTKRNDEYKFKYDNNVVYMQLLYNIHSLLITMTKRHQNISEITSDAYYKEIIRFDKKTSVIVKMCHRANRCTIIEKIMYGVLAIVY